MAIYHFSAKVISRAAGSSALAAAAYRSASRLHDQRIDRHHDFSNKAGVIHSQVMLPESAPDHLSHRERLWNEVEAAEKRIDAQLAREIEFAIPRELSPELGIALARDFVRDEFVSRGMIADLNVHWDVGADGPKPHAHVMLTMRQVGEDGFGAKVRGWNRTELLQHWREAWANHVNRRLAELDIEARIDHRSLEAQGIDLEPQNKIGPAAARMSAEGPQLERVDEHRDIARVNGEKLLANPPLALDAITHGQATFTARDLAMFVHRHSEGKEQFDRVLAAVKASPELVRLGRDGRGDERFTSRSMLMTEQRLERAAVRLEARRRHLVLEAHCTRALAQSAERGLALSSEQKSAFEHVSRSEGLSVVIGYAGTGKSAMLGVAREAWEAAGYRVQGAALSGIAAENLEAGSGIQSRTIASLEHQWAQGRELLGQGDVLVLDEAGMIGTRQMERAISEAEKRGAKVVLVGDPEQLQAIEAGAAFRAIAERHGSVEITDIRRQREDWQRTATRQLATGRIGEALAAYADHGFIHCADARHVARQELIERWDDDRSTYPEATRVILTHTNDEVQALNALARDRLRDAGELGENVTIGTTHGSRDFASRDRIMFLRNERSLGVKNGSLGRIENLSAVRMTVLLDDGRHIAFDFKHYADLEHGYAATIHKAQGMTVDRVHMLATPGLDRHAAYVALTRHRHVVDIHYGQDDFADRAQLSRALSRDRPKDMAIDSQRGFAERRSIIVPEATARVVRQALGKEQRSTPQPTRQHELFASSAPARRQHRGSTLEQAVQRFGQATAKIVSIRCLGCQEGPRELEAFHAARRSLDAVLPNAARDLRAAFAEDMGLIDEAAAGRTRGSIRAMVLQAEIRRDPHTRADRFVAEWRRLGNRHHRFERAGDEARAGRIAAQMSALARGLERDPQVESLLRHRHVELGVPPYLAKPLSQALPEWFGLGRGRGIQR